MTTIVIGSGKNRSVNLTAFELWASKNGADIETIVENGTKNVKAVFGPESNIVIAEDGGITACSPYSGGGELSIKRVKPKKECLSIKSAFADEVRIVSVRGSQMYIKSEYMGGLTETEVIVD